MARDVVSRPAALPTATIEAGIAAGIIGGLAMAMFEMIYTLMTMGDLLMPLRPMGATFYGPGTSALRTTASRRGPSYLIREAQLRHHAIQRATARRDQSPSGGRTAGQSSANVNDAWSV